MLPIHYTVISFSSVAQLSSVFHPPTSPFHKPITGTVYLVQVHPAIGFIHTHPFCRGSARGCAGRKTSCSFSPNIINLSVSFLNLLCILCDLTTCAILYPTWESRLRLLPVLLWLLFSKAIWQSRVASSCVPAFALPTDGINYSSSLTLPNSSSMG